MNVWSALAFVALGFVAGVVLALRALPALINHTDSEPRQAYADGYLAGVRTTELLPGLIEELRCVDDDRYHDARRDIAGAVLSVLCPRCRDAAVEELKKS